MKNFICSWLHGDGSIKRDDLGRINWQCKKCGRWADSVPLEQEKRMTNRAIEAKLKAKNGFHSTEKNT